MVCTIAALTATGQAHVDLLHSGETNFATIEASVEESYANGELSKREYKHYMRWALEARHRLDKDGNLFNYPMHNYKELQKFLRAQPRSDTSRAVNGH